MATKLRRLGVYGDNLPVKRENQIVPADFLIGGLLGQFERKYNRTYRVTGESELQEIFGAQETEGFYGWDAARGFFANVSGVDASLYVGAYVGNDGTVIDAVVASADISDGTNDTLRLQAGYQEEPQYGQAGNRTGYRIENGARFSTELAAEVLAAATSAQLDSVVGVRVGDVMHFTNAGGTYDEYHKITEVNEGTGTVTWTDAAWGATPGAAGDTAEVMGFRLRTFVRSKSGLVTEVETDLGRVWCTMEPEVTDFYVQNVHARNRHLIATDLGSASVPQDSFPEDQLTTAYLASGADGTSPTGAANWGLALANFDEDPVRFLAIPETTTAAVNKAGEAYCAARQDNPKWIYTIPEDQTKAQLVTIGQGYQRSDEVFGVVVANWLEVDDPFATSEIAPDRHVPNCGHVMGNWVRVVGRRGIHYVPAVKNFALRGCNGVVGEQFKEDLDRTDLAEAGVNVIQELQGYGIVIRNFFTPSIDRAYQFANGGLMKSFFKVSIVDSLQPEENTPNSLEKVKQNGTTVRSFMQRIWERGSAGNAAPGETFGRGERADGSPERFEDLVEIVADATNNPQSSINAGERNVDLWFSYPAPAGSIKIGVGILLRS